MKRLVLVFMGLLMTAALIFSADVSTRKDIAVFPVYSSYELPSATYSYFDSQLIYTLNNMQRFQVIGYQYHLDNTSAESFIQKIQDLKKQQALNNSNYIDADLGVAVIPASEMEKLANSFYIIIPSIIGYGSQEKQIEIDEKDKDTGKVKIRFVTEYTVDVHVSLRIIDPDGKLLNAYDSSSESKSQKNLMDAIQTSVNSAMGGVTMFFRNTEEFKLKTQVLDLRSGSVFVQLGKDLGVRPGYEFAIQSQKTVFNNLVEKETTGILRISDVKDQYSEAAVIFGNPQIGDQLVETPMIGLRFMLSGGISPMKIPTENVVIKYVNTGIAFSSTNKFTKSDYAANFGLNFESEIGYAGLLDLNFGMLLNNPLAFYGDLGGGYELYFGSISATIGADASFVLLDTPLGTYNHTNSISINDQTFDDGEDMSVALTGFTVGIKPKLTLNWQLSQGFKIRLTGGYGFYFLPSYNVSFSYGSGSDAKSTTVNVTDSSVTLLADGVKQSGIPIDFGGPFAGIELMFRF